MQTQTPPLGRWRYAMAVTPNVLKVDYAGRHETVLLSEITGVTRMGGWPAITVVVMHRGGTLKLMAVPKHLAKELISVVKF